MTLTAEVTFASGVTCLFDKGLRLAVTAQGAIIANALTDPISFKGLVEAPGAWFGIEIHSPSPINSMDGVIIRHGGFIGGRGANIYLYGDTPAAKLTITNSEIYKASTNVSLTDINNTFSNNSSGNVGGQ